MRYNELIDNQIYIAANSITTYIMKANKGGTQAYIRTGGRYFGTDAQFSVWDGDHYSVASPEQVAHLEACISANMYVDPPKINVTQQFLIFN